MKIAVPYESGAIFQHFGRTEQFMVYTVTDGKITGREPLRSGESGHAALAGLLQGAGVDTLLCGGIGGGAQAALSDAGIRLCGGASGSADDAVAALLAGTLRCDSGASCGCQDRHDGHGCAQNSDHDWGRPFCGEPHCTQ